MPVLKNANNKIVMTMPNKKTLVRLHTFPKPLTIIEDKYKPSSESSYFLIIKDLVAKRLLYNLVKKVPWPNLHNF